MLIPPTLLQSSLRYHLRHPWQLCLAILGVALGVAVVVAIDLANVSARAALTFTTTALEGRTTHQIVGGPAGLDETIYRKLRVDLHMRDSAPRIEGYATVPGHPGLTLHILGIDPLAEAHLQPALAPALTTGADLGALLSQPGSALLSADTARAADIAVGSVLPLQIGAGKQHAMLIGLIAGQDNLTRQALDQTMIVDISTAQEWFGMVGHLSTIDLVVPDDPGSRQELQAIRAMLPGGARLVVPTQRSAALQQLTNAFETNLSALSLLALVVGSFLIYNTITFAVVQRRALFGTVRCLGVTRWQICILVLGEGLLLSLLGAGIGLLLGVLMGRGLVYLVIRTINDLYFVLSIHDIVLDPLVLLKGLLLGVLATLAAAALPAWEATTTPARQVLRRSSYEERTRRLTPQLALGGAGAIGIGLLLLGIPGQSLLLSFVGLLVVTLGIAATTPWLTIQSMRLAQPILGWGCGLLGRMAARDVVAALSRTSVAIAALMLAVAVTIGVGLMVGSFRQTVIAWLDTTLQADIFVSAPGPSGPSGNPGIPPEVLQRLSHTPGVAGVRRYRTIVTDTPTLGLIDVLGSDIVPGRDDRAYIIREGNPDRLWQEFLHGDVLVSESLAYRHTLHVGDSIVLYSTTGQQRFRIAGLYEDYGSQYGEVMISLPYYQHLWQDKTISSLAVFAAQGVAVEPLIQHLRQQVGPDQILEIRSNQALRAGSLEVFDQTFAITTVLQLLATIVAFVGILAALMALQLERSRELGMLRAQGMTPQQL